MRYDEASGFVALNAAELRGAATGGGRRPSPITPAVLGGATAADVEAWQGGVRGLPEEGRDRLTKASARLADPTRLVELCLSPGRGKPRRLHYAWPDGAGRLAVLAASGAGYVVGLRTAGDLAATLQGALGLDAAFVGSDVQTPLDGRAVLALVALVDVLRAARLRAELSHQLPLESASAADVAARLMDARAEDPRWPLCALEKVLPFDLAAAADVPSVTDSLGRLAAAGLVDVAEPSGRIPSLFSPSAALEPLVEEAGRAVAHVALTLYERAGSAVAYESALLVRGPLSLWLFSLAPQGGGVASLGPSGAARFLDRLTRESPAAGRILS